jgi:chromosome segregation ATPase
MAPVNPAGNRCQQLLTDANTFNMAAGSFSANTVKMLADVYVSPAQLHSTSQQRNQKIIQGRELLTKTMENRNASRSLNRQYRESCITLDDARDDLLHHKDLHASLKQEFAMNGERADELEMQALSIFLGFTYIFNSQKNCFASHFFIMALRHAIALQTQSADYRRKETAALSRIVRDMEEDTKTLKAHADKLTNPLHKSNAELQNLRAKIRSSRAETAYLKSESQRLDEEAKKITSSTKKITAIKQQVEQLIKDIKRLEGENEQLDLVDETEFVRQQIESNFEQIEKKRDEIRAILQQYRQQMP